jgi:hypothetical protein
MYQLGEFLFGRRLVRRRADDVVRFDAHGRRSLLVSTRPFMLPSR